MEMEFGGFSTAGLGARIPATGVYLIQFQVSASNGFISVLLNGTSSGNIATSAYGNNGGNLVITGSAIASLVGGEIITLRNNSTTVPFTTLQSVNATYATIPVGLIIMRLQ
jgi:hypothetical protein